MLRLKGMSYNEINSALSVSKSTLHLWLKNTVLSSRAQSRLRSRVRDGSLKGLIRKNKLQTHEAKQRAIQNRNIGREKISALSERELLLLGAALYWGEGYKKPIITDGKIRTHHSVTLSNSDPYLIRIFLRFLRDCFHVNDENIHVELRIYDHMNEHELLSFWQKITNLPATNFSKTYYGVSISSTRKRGYYRLPYGTVQIRVNSTNLFHQIMGLIEGISATND